ncbi:putative receptor-like protein kinase THESEUS 1-like, partial [Capsicum annuum]
MVVLSCATSAYPTHTMRMTSAKLPVCLSSAKMAVLSCATPACPTRTLRITSSIVPVYSSSRVSVHPSDSPFIPEVNKAVDSLSKEFREVDNLVARNTARVLRAFQRVKVGSHHFGGSTGYGHEEAGGREALDQAFAEIVGAESAIVRAQFFSGTHAITCALFAFLRPGDELLAVAGAPYDTLEEVIGKRDSGGLGSLKDFGVEYREVPLAEDGGLDWDALKTSLRPHTKCALIQRSCGYSWRRSLSVTEIGEAINIIKMQNSGCLVMVDNCYGEFVDDIEPPMVGADLIAGSLIKNPGGTIAPCGGYVAGKKRWVEAAAARLSAPGLGVDCGSTPGDIMRTLFQGLFLSPQMVGEAIKGSFLIAEVMAAKGYKVQPLCRVKRHDTVQAVELGSRERLLSFCEAVQRSSPVSSFIRPVAGASAGYASEVIFADGTFIDGSTSELSCDGPLREPFSVFCQGGTHWTQWGLVLGE